MATVVSGVRSGLGLLGWLLLILAAIVATAWAFHRMCPPAGWLLAPYLLRVSFATFLTLTLWKLNR
jgi:tryptophan-rich sensory protein